MIQTPYPKNRLKPIIIIFILFIFIIIIISALGIAGVFHHNPYGPELKIDNYNQYIKNSPIDTRDATFTALYNTVQLNLDKDKIPANGAKIRDQSFVDNFQENANIHYNTFIVDIESIQQSYYAQVSWSDDPEANLGGYPILFTCPTKEQLIYPEFNCTSLIEQNKLTQLYNKYPIIDQLPQDISYYLNNYSTYVHYRITYETSEDEISIKLIIDDYSGGNLENAKKKIRELDSKADQYPLEYNDLSNNPDSEPGRAPNDIPW